MRIVYFVLFIIISLNGIAQETYSTKNKKAIAYYEEASVYIHQRNYSRGINTLNLALQKDENFIEAHNKLAFCFELLKDTERQKQHLEAVVKLDLVNKYQNARYSLGKVYYQQGKYEEAKTLIESFLSYQGVDGRIVKEAQNTLVNINFALEHIQKPVDFDPKPMPKEVNMLPLQYFPILTADENIIFFTGRRGLSFYDDEDIYLCIKDENGKWSLPMPISQNINSQFNEGTCTISADGQILIFTTCEGRQSYGGCDLYISYLVGEEWTPPENLGPNINSRSWESQPSLSPDGRLLYFVSDRAGGSGKRDIWVSEMDADGVWQKSRNLGPEVNSPGDEVSPYIHVNGVSLFFASNYLPGFGGYDLFLSELTNKGWTNPTNLGYPINDHNDQVSLFLSVDGRNAYYSFEIKQNGQPNKSLLYTFTYPESKQLSKKSNYLSGKILESGTNKPLKATIELIDLKSDKTISIFESNKLSGEYFTILTEGSNYALYVEKEGYLFESRSFEYKNEASEKPLKEDFKLKPILIGEKTPLNNIYFDIDSDKLRPESLIEIKKLKTFLNQNPHIRIEISGHTDDIGSESYNLDLSTRRAKSVYTELHNLGADIDRIQFKGYGMTRPISENRDPASRQLNRRIEFLIIR